MVQKKSRRRADLVILRYFRVARLNFAKTDSKNCKKRTFTIVHSVQKRTFSLASKLKIFEFLKTHFKKIFLSEKFFLTFCLLKKRTFTIGQLIKNGQSSFFVQFLKFFYPSSSLIFFRSGGLKMSGNGHIWPPALFGTLLQKYYLLFFIKVIH